MKITMFYDDTCVLCRTNAKQLSARAPDLISVNPVREGKEILAEYNISELDAMTYVCVQDETGEMHKGMDAVRLLYRTAGYRITPILSLPLLSTFFDLVYPVIARNRYKLPRWLIRLIYGEVNDISCQDGCRIPPTKRATKAEN